MAGRHVTLDNQLTRMSVLVEIARSMSRRTELDEVLQTVYRQVGRIFDTTNFYIATYRQGEEQWQWTFHIEDGERQPPQCYDLNTGITSYIIRQRRPLLFANRQQLDAFLLRGWNLIGQRPQSWMGVPLIANDEVLGVMAIQNYLQTDLYDEQDLELFTTIGTQVAVVIQNARLFEAERRKSEELAMLVEIGQDLAATLDYEAVLKRIVRSACKKLTENSVALFLVDENDSMLKVVATEGVLTRVLTGFSVPLGTGIVGGAVLEGLSQIVNDASRDPRSIRIPGTNANEKDEKLLVVPLLLKGAAIGAMAAWRGPYEPRFEYSELAFLESLSREAVIALHNASLFRQAEQARREAEDANRAKSRFLANTSHELRTPLNAIINFSWLLIQEGQGLSEDQLGLLHRIEDSGRNLLSLINDILDIAKIEAGKIDISLQAYDILDIIEGVIPTVQALLVGQAVCLDWQRPESLPMVLADAFKLRQVFLNLFSNAVKFTPQGFIALRVWTDDGRMYIAVEDSGIGMAPEDIQRAMAEFVQLDDSSCREHKGTGLGLAITKRFIELMHGQLRVASTPGKGSVFTFDLPLAPRD